MQTSIQQLLQINPMEGIAALVLAFVLFVLLGLLPALGLLYLVYLVLTLPLRRNERVRLFLDLLERGMREGRAPETAIADAASTGDPSLGQRFLLVGSMLRSGMRLSQALGQVPRMVPPQVRAMLATGERIGDVAKVLPACRLVLRDSVSQVRGALNYLLLLSFITSPAMIAIPLILKIKVLPSFKAVFAGFVEGTELPGITRFVFAGDWLFVGFQIGIFALIWLLTLTYIGGPRLRDMLDGVLMGRTLWVDWLACRFPWRRKRLQRDFSAILAALLEAGVPESEAVRLAGESTANGLMRRRSADVCTRLKNGVPLPEALRRMDDSGELRWRLSNALRGRTGFPRALAGWLEALDAKAFQLEQSAAQVLTTVVVLINGLLVSCILIAMFLPLIQLITQVSLW
jgi:type II secretory pathway component PulF